MSRELSVQASETSIAPPTAAAARGIRKSAILLLSLQPQQARQILSRLPSDAVRAVRDEMASLRKVPTIERSKVVQAYRRELAQVPVARALAPSAVVSIEVQPDPLHDCSPDAIFEALCDEHPQCIAAVLASLPVEKAGQCLSRLTIRTQIEVIRRLASLREFNGAVLEEVYTAIRRRAQQSAARHLPCPVLARVLNEADEPEREQAPEQPNSRYVFEDLLRLNERGLRLVLDEIDEPALGLAISTVSKRFRRRVLGLLSKSVALDVRHAAAARPLYLSDIESAQAKILRIVQRLEAAGEISLPSATTTPTTTSMTTTTDKLARKGA